MCLLIGLFLVGWHTFSFLKNPVGAKKNESVVKSEKEGGKIREKTLPVVLPGGGQNSEKSSQGRAVDGGSGGNVVGDNSGSSRLPDGSTKNEKGKVSGVQTSLHFFYEGEEIPDVKGMIVGFVSVGYSNYILVRNSGKVSRYMIVGRKAGLKVGSCLVECDEAGGFSVGGTFKKPEVPDDRFGRRDVEVASNVIG